MHKVQLPTANLDKSKKYYVTFTIDKAHNGGNGGQQSRGGGFSEVIEETSFEESSEAPQAMASANYVIPQVESR